MKRTFFCFLLLSCISLSLTAQNQDSKLKISIYYPLSLEDNRYQDVYDGILGGGAVYELAQMGPFGLGASVDVVFSGGNTLILHTITPFKHANSIIVQPGLELALRNGRWHPNIRVGYTKQWVSYELRPGREDRGLDTTESYGGINLGIGLNFDLSNSFFIQLGYDRTFLDNEATSEDFSKNVEAIGILKAGLGLRL